jgi:ferredoxin
VSVRLRFEPAGLELDAALGERVLDAADDHPAAGLPLACRAGNCGACLVSVLAGASALQAPDAGERETLAALGAEPWQRLACQLVVREGAGPVILSIVSPVSSASGQT